MSTCSGLYSLGYGPQAQTGISSHNLPSLPSEATFMEASLLFSSASSPQHLRLTVPFLIFLLNVRGAWGLIMLLFTVLFCDYSEQYTSPLP